MRTWMLPLMGALVASSSFAEEGQSTPMSGRSRIGIVVVETTRAAVADSFVEILMADLGRASGGGAEFVGPEELRGTIAPNVKRHKAENAAIQKCLATPGCVSRVIVDKDLTLFGAGFLGRTVHGDYRVQLVFYDSFGREAARDDLKIGKEGTALPGAFPSVVKALESITVAFQFTPDPGAETFLNDRQVQVERIAFLKPDTYQVRVLRPECRPWQQTFDGKAGTAHTVASPPCNPWVPVKAGELRDQCLHYTRLSPPNWVAARQKCEEALAAGGKEDSKLLFTLARIAHEELELEKSFDYAERAVQVTSRPSAEEDVRAAQKFIAEVLRNRYGPVIVKLDESAKVNRGYVHLRDKGGLINPEKKRVFSALRERLAVKEITLDREGTMFYLPFGTYKANAVPFTVEPGKTPEVEIILEAVPPPPVSAQAEEKRSVPLSVWAVSGVGVAALVTGAALHVSAFGKVDEYMAATTQEDADRAKRGGERLQTYAGALYGTAAVAAGAAFLLYTWTAPKVEETVQVTPLPGGVAASVSF